MTTGKALDGKSYAGNPHVRFDEGEVAPAATPRRGSLLYKLKSKMMLVAAFATTLAISSLGDTWPASSCVVSGSTNRTCSAVSNQPLSTALDSYWLGLGSGTLSKRFSTRPPTGAIVIVF